MVKRWDNSAKTYFFPSYLRRTDFVHGEGHIPYVGHIALHHNVFLCVCVFFFWFSDKDGSDDTAPPSCRPIWDDYFARSRSDAKVSLNDTVIYNSQFAHLPIGSPELHAIVRSRNNGRRTHDLGRRAWLAFNAFNWIFTRATHYSVARSLLRQRVRLSVCPSVCHTRYCV